MANGLDVGLREFKRMSSIDRDVTMYNKLITIGGKFKDYQLNKKIQYFWLVLLTIVLGLKKFLII